MSNSRPAPFHPLVRELDRRLRLTRLSRDLAWALGAVGLALLAPRIAGEGMPALAAAVALAGAGALAFRYFRRTPADLGRAAAAGDRSGDLSDELGSAQWFSENELSGSGAATGWEAYQIARARRRADDLEAAALTPLTAPRPTIYAAASVAALLAVLPLFEGPLLSDALRARLGGSFAAGGPGEEEPTTARDEAEDAEDARTEARSPEEVLAELRAGELPLPEEPGDDADALRAALAEAMEERAFGETSEEVTAALAGLAETLDSADGLAATEWLDDLAEAMRAASTPEELRELLESLGAGAEGDAAAAEMMELMESGMSAEEAFQQLAENMQAANGQQGTAPGEGDAQSMPFPGDGEGGGQPQAGEGGEPAAGMPQGAAGMSGQVQMVSAEGQMGAPMPLDAGPAGNMTGPGGGGESEVFGAVTSLEVQLEMEAIPAPVDEEPIPEQMIERQSRREDASVAYDSVRPLEEYADEAAARSNPIPAGLRPLVRAYFLMIRETATAPDETPAENAPAENAPDSGPDGTLDSAAAAPGAPQS